MARLASFPTAATAAALLLAGCATRPVQAPVATAEMAPAVPPPPVVPAGIPASLNVPATDADGTYLTINHALDPAETAWHVRSALNVAALSCRGANEGQIIAAYNSLLRTQKKALAAALKATEAQYRKEQGKSWQTEHDRHMTRVYNFFAQPPAQRAFCETAAAVLAEASAVPADGFLTFAATALPRLEQPFTDVFRAYDGYHRDLAAWQSRYGTAEATAVASIDAAGVPKLAYADMGALIRWDGREQGERTAAR